MKEENKNCQLCHRDFLIDQEDFSFYEKIKVPPPTCCPECRFKSRYAFRNNLNLHKRKCDLCQKDIISMYSQEKPFPVFCRECFYGDTWDATSYGLNYDFSKPFFEQFKILSDRTPRINLIGTNKINSDFCNHVTDVKNIYLSFSIGASEDCFFMGPQCVRDKNCSSCSTTRDSEWSYMLVDCENCYKVGFSQNSMNCFDSLFLYDCRNCSNCLGCTNLRNQSYCIFNEQYTKEEYFQIKESYKLDTFTGLHAFMMLFNEFKKKAIRKYAVFNNTQDCTGDFIYQSKNCKECFTVVDSENTKYGFISNGSKDCMDVCHTYPNAELVYYSMSAIHSNRIFFSNFMYSNCFDVWYSDNCYTTKDSFGCISLKNKSYCILNKQYEKEEYLELIEKIKQQMITMPYTDAQGVQYGFGDFFPMEISPFAYNESAVHEYFPLTKDVILTQGLSWYEPEKKGYVPTFVFENQADISFLEDERICAEIIECTHLNTCDDNCLTAFKILPDELRIYRMLGVAIPDTCHNCRYHERLKLKNPSYLWHRKCMKEGCVNEFQTSYAPERPEVIYCEKCYQQEVY